MQPTTQYAPDLRSTPEGSRLTTFRIDSLLPWLIFVIAVAYLSVFLRYSALEPDEGIILAGAERVLRGEVPYRDFFAFYTPGSFYLVAGLFRIFGDSFAVARFSIIVSGALFPVITYVLARRGCSRPTSVFVASLALFTGVAYRFLVLHNWYSTLLAGLALYSALRLIETHRPVWALATGSLCSLTALFEQSKGAGVCFGLVLGFLTQRFVQRKQLFRNAELRGFVIGFAGPVLLVVGFFAAQHSLAMMFEDWLWPLRHYGLANHVPYGYQNWSDHSRQLIFHTGPTWAIIVKALTISPGFLVPAMPLLAAGFYVYWSVLALRRTASAETAAYYVTVSSALIGLLFSVLVSRADIIHFMYLLPFWLIPLAWILDSKGINSQLLTSGRSCLIFFFAVSFGLMALALLSTATGARDKLISRRGLVSTAKIDTVLPYMNSHSAPGDAVLVYPYLPLYYYLSGTRSVGRLDYLQPGMNTKEQAQEMLASLQSHPDSPVLFEPGFWQKIGTSWPETPVGLIVRDPIGDYIAHNYRICQRLESSSGSFFEYMVRRERDCP